MIRAFTPDDVPTLVAQSADIAGGDPRDAAWFMARQHLVYTIARQIIGHTSWTQYEGYITWDETYVAPAYRKCGVGGALMAARDQRTPGLVFGACKPENEPMVHLLTSMGFHACQTVPGGFSDGDAVIWARGHGF